MLFFSDQAVVMPYLQPLTMIENLLLDLIVDETGTAPDFFTTQESRNIIMPSGRYFEAAMERPAVSQTAVPDVGYRLR